MDLQNQQLQNLRLRMTSDEVCHLARFSKNTLLQRVKKGTFPKPIDRCGNGYVWNTSVVLGALGFDTPQSEQTANPWEKGLQ